ncbi:MAG: excinuclease ABC subunit A, partial [Bacteroidales bacterium]|nr:excinuclease ABC subunit A [Bacteroidales bacterium]
AALRSAQEVLLVIDRIALHLQDEGGNELLMRVADSIEAAFYEGRGVCYIEMGGGDDKKRYEFSNRFEADGMTFEKPNPNFFSFNNPYGACHNCQGFGSTIGIDENIVVPNKKLSIYEDAVVCWRGEKMSEWKSLLIKQSGKIGFPIHRPYLQLDEHQKDILWNGAGDFPGIYGFFECIDSQSYKIQYRVMMARYRGKTVCPDCRGTRLRKDASYVKVGGKSITDLVLMPVDQLYDFIVNLELTPYEQSVSQRIMVELRNRLQYLLDVGLGYLTLNRFSNTLSGGESQRINLATSLGSSLVGSMYILDEPSIGLHPRDTDRLIKVLKQLRDLGNTVVVVEHDEEIIRAADHIIDVGPYAGRLGGEIVFSGTFDKLVSEESRSLTADFMRGNSSIPLPPARRTSHDFIRIGGAWENNLKDVEVAFPLHNLVVVTGVSGSGKTSLVKNVLYDVLQKRLDGMPDYTGKCTEVTGDLSRISGVELIDQNPIGRSTRSNPASYIKAFDEIRQLYASQPLAQKRGYKPGYFSFNVEGGRCDTCQGEGSVTIEMQFMADVHLVCEDCHGKRYKEDTLEVLYNGKNIFEVLEMTVDQAIDFFAADTAVTPQRIVERLKPLQDVGLGYLKLGQSSSSLSGGEAQRVKLA